MSVLSFYVIAVWYDKTSFHYTSTNFLHCLLSQTYFLLIYYILIKRRVGDSVQFDTAIVGRVVKRLRTEKGMTQEILSGFAGVARTHLTMIENGSKQANFETLWRIALALDMKPSELVTIIENEISRSDSDNGK